jgi:hypothetical protein
MVYANDGTDYEPSEAPTGAESVRSQPAERFDPMHVMNLIEKQGSPFGQVQW